MGRKATFPAQSRYIPRRPDRMQRALRSFAGICVDTVTEPLHGNLARDRCPEPSPGNLARNPCRDPNPRPVDEASEERRRRERAHGVSRGYSDESRLSPKGRNNRCRRVRSRCIAPDGALASLVDNPRLTPWAQALSRLGAPRNRRALGALRNRAPSELNTLNETGHGSVAKSPCPRDCP